MIEKFKQIHVEEIKRKEEFLSTTLLDKVEVKKAIDEALLQVTYNMKHVKQKFPYSATKDHIYPVIENIEWTDGFWTGLLWLAYEHTKDEMYKELACRNVQSFHHRIQQQIEVEHHDLGFLYSLSCVAAYKVLHDEEGKTAALLAADKLITRYQEKGEFIQAWGEVDNPQHYRFIIDCLLNIPLLYWASEVSGKSCYAQIAKKHFETSCRYVIRDDASAYHTFYMDPETGKPVRGATRQGYSDTSSWARGQAWGIYGIPLNYRYTKEDACIPLYKGMCNYFLNRLPNDCVCYWDLIFTNDEEQSRDSSAAAIAVCGMLEMHAHLPDSDPDKAVYEKAAHRILRSLLQNYTSSIHEPGNPILYHGVYSWHSGKGIDEGNIWGDYFYLEALTRLAKQWDIYW